MQTGNPLQLDLLGYTDGDRERESDFHRLFDKYRIGGEWFKPAGELLDVINKLANETYPALCEGGEHKTPRTAVQLPTAWFSLARKLAAKQQQPTMWFLLRAIAEKADEVGEERPRLPWEEEQG
jgi:hypothetical protein